MITLGFDGARGRKRGITDATALIACRVSRRPRLRAVPDLACGSSRRKWPTSKVWSPPVVEIVAAVDAALKKWKVVGFYADPAMWESYVAGWEAKYGRQAPGEGDEAAPDRVVDVRAAVRRQDRRPEVVQGRGPGP